MTLTESIKTCFKKYATFHGRASRSEFWYFYLSTKALTCILSFVFVWAAIVLYVLTLMPAHAVAVRRLRDQQRLIWQILILSPIVLIANFFFLGALDEELYASDPDIFLLVTVFWALPTFRAFWILSGPSGERTISDQNNEVTP